MAVLHSSFRLCFVTIKLGFLQLTVNIEITHVLNVLAFATVMSTKSDSDVIHCLQLRSKTLAVTLHLS